MQNLFILIASYVFYGWWDWRFLILIAFTSFCSWGSGILIDNHRNKGRLFNALNVVVNIGILGVFKYYDFFALSFADLFLDGNSDGLLLNIILPVGISFYTFQALSYSIDVYKQKITPTKSVIDFFVYVSFFPQLVAGPIERATNLLPQFQMGRVFSYSQAVDGMRQMLWGLFKKVVIADTCAVYVNQVFNDYTSQNGITLLLGAVFFAFQIYGDFSGYSDIAIGCAKLFGIKLMRNFNNPYFSRDIAEFWRHWHISLTTWFRDYIYFPLGGSRCSKVKTIRNVLVIFLVSGIWHGANWTFLAWGGFHALFYIPVIMSGKNKRHRGLIAENRMFPSFSEILKMCFTFILVVLGWVFFRSESITDSFQYLAGIFNASLFSLPGWKSIAIKNFILVFIMLACEWFSREKEHPLQFSGVLFSVTPVRYLIYMILSLMVFTFSMGEQQFIYFQF